MSQKRIARIEAAPGRTSLDQISRLVALLGGQVVIEYQDQAGKRKPDRPRAGW